jgi:hypothetical protein
MRFSESMGRTSVAGYARERKREEVSHHRDTDEEGKNSNGHPRGWPSLTHHFTGFTARGDVCIAPDGLPAGAAWLLTWFTGLGFVHREGTTRQLGALKPLNGGFGRLALGHLDEPKAFGTASVTVGNDIDLVHHAIRLEELAEVLLGGGIRQITNKDIHRVFPMGRGDKRSPGHPNSMQEHKARVIRRRAAKSTSEVSTIACDLFGVETLIYSKSTLMARGMRLFSTARARSRPHIVF